MLNGNKNNLYKETNFTACQTVLFICCIKLVSVFLIKFKFSFFKTEFLNLEITGLGKNIRLL